MPQRRKRRDAGDRGASNSVHLRTEFIAASGVGGEGGEVPGTLETHTLVSSPRSPASARMLRGGTEPGDEACLGNGSDLIRETSSFPLLELSEAQFLVECEVRRLIHAHLHRFNVLRGKTKLAPAGGVSPDQARGESTCCLGEASAPKDTQEKEGTERTRQAKKEVAPTRGETSRVAEPPLTCHITPPFLGRRVATSVLAPRPFPAFRAALVDGYALRLTPEVGGSRQPSRSVSSSQKRGPEAQDDSRLALRIVQKVRAGGESCAFRHSHMPTNPQSSLVTQAAAPHPADSTPGKQAGGAQDTCPESTCVYVTTGAPVPPQFQAVLPVEACVVDREKSLCMPDLAALAALRPGTNIRAVGSDVAAGLPLMEQGQRVGPAEEGLLASFDVHRLEVYRYLNVHTLAIGDELVSRVAGVGQKRGEDEEFCARNRGVNVAGSSSVDGATQASSKCAPQPPLSPAAAHANKAFPGESPKSAPAKVFDSNSPTLAALVADRCPSAQVRAQHFLPDDVAAVRTLLVKLATGARGKAALAGCSPRSGDQLRTMDGRGKEVTRGCECPWCAEMDAKTQANGPDNVGTGVDVLITTGGVSMGDSDCVKLALLQLQEETRKRQELRDGKRVSLEGGLGFSEREKPGKKQLSPVCDGRSPSFRIDTEIHFGRLNVKPGKPAIVASLRVYRTSSESPPGAGKDSTTEASPCRTLLVFALPGNPCSSWVLFHLLVGPALQFFSSFSPSSSLSCHLPPQVPVRLAAPLRPDASRPEFQRSLVYVDFSASTECRSVADARLSPSDLPVLAQSLSPPARCEGLLSSRFCSACNSPQVYLHAFPTGAQQSSRLLSCCGNANALILVPPRERSGRDRHEKGEVLWAWLLDTPFPAPPKMLLKLLTLQEERQQRAQGRPASFDREVSTFPVGRCRCGDQRSRDPSELLHAAKTEVNTLGFSCSSGVQRNPVSEDSLEKDGQNATHVGECGEAVVADTDRRSRRHVMETANEARPCFLGVVVVSDRCSEGVMKDACVEAALSSLRVSPELAKHLQLDGLTCESIEVEKERGHANHVASRIVPDEQEQIQKAVMSLVCRRMRHQATRGEGNGKRDYGDDQVGCNAFGPCLIFVCGGTGLSVRDVTPQALLPLFSVRCNGLEHLLMQASLTCTPMAALGRPCAGIATCSRQRIEDLERCRAAGVTKETGGPRKKPSGGLTQNEAEEFGDVDRRDAHMTCDCGARALVFGLPGSPQAVRECIQALLPVLPHALEVVTSGA
ncbi:MoeA N-terminal region (domain I and II) domain-containing protein [Toxoplasma gondii TgCatPRC2]|uniref:molybdopterin adenylyltransferase n=9 Tax=Toxoplasma gondii TaxID=5811 RepID=A0A0F7UNE7_TOXGV|nr:MoeA N-terminal region (domain I and II) domain-containing protein [Toxoplasma gondii ME49]EPR57634.1 MoeA N-terminal region (domain I and II) domain-containing protein [Toxoplasma gondii GT1]ESS29245.1 MoeA N-terminal region (domain I and II) domain-containing protein [Toxoplasma gondii VEG]KAF4646092.1 MoeA N-terminal region (domain I and II) domain-containing protein [Toxoplasma gondii]KFG35721.1 MoeA N-terminal region (domain I and II) domain-containing protein [Toxoplasma gondii p89]KF|eukprot:XP_002370150.1 MoeA N-terminal region (domain I and II) domain-containing protein [Toxoplasma gondii ME49]